MRMVINDNTTAILDAIMNRMRPSSPYLSKNSKDSDQEISEDEKKDVFEHGPITVLRINVPTGDASQTNSSDEANQRQPIFNETPPIFREESSSADEKGLVSPLLKGN